MDDEKRFLAALAGTLFAGFVAVIVAGYATAGAYLVNLAAIFVIALAVAAIVLALVRNMLAGHRRQMEEMAMTDELTRVANRSSFDAISNQLFRSVERRKVTLSALLLGIDNFKRINDGYGHLAGDAVIREFAAIVRERFRKSDLIFRWGGDEFLILVPECNIAEAEQLAEKVRRAIAEGQTPFEGRNIAVTVSAGVAERRQDEAGGELVTRADHALYAAKRDGRNRVAVAD